MNMLQASDTPSDLISRIFDFLLKNEWAFMLLVIMWIAIVYVLKKYVGISVSGWSVLISFIASLLLVIGIVAILISG